MPENVTDTLNASLGGLSLMTVLYALLTLVICLIAVKIILTVLRKILGRSKLDTRVAGYIVSAAKIVLLVITVLIVADQLGIPITSLIALLSVLSLAVTLAIQTVLSNVAGGLVIMASKPFAIGDYVAAGGSEGTVAEIRLTHTFLDSPAGQRIVLPNGSLSGEKVVNYTKLGRRRVEVTVSASYDMPVQKVREAMLNAAGRCEKVLQDPAPAVMVSSYGESSIQYLIHCWCNAADYWGAYFPLTEEIKRCFDEAGVAMTFNHLNIHILDK
ncbi:MAG: mechanosensitive ion channel family protein [Ruminococcaceae bacterium]|jgi:small conductance mechanosensitive channel|nr:mechanosensitive ion channel family protein [Oscillospiraceae bacterium]